MKNGNNSSFEDKLRQRIHEEDMEYDPMAWEQFQAKYTEPVVDSAQEIKNKGWVSLLRWMVPILILLVGVFLFIGDDVTEDVLFKANNEKRTGNHILTKSEAGSANVVLSTAEGTKTENIVESENYRAAHTPRQTVGIANEVSQRIASSDNVIKEMRPSVDELDTESKVSNPINASTAIGSSGFSSLPSAASNLNEILIDYSKDDIMGNNVPDRKSLDPTVSRTETNNSDTVFKGNGEGLEQDASKTIASVNKVNTDNINSTPTPEEVLSRAYEDLLNAETLTNDILLDNRVSEYNTEKLIEPYKFVKNEIYVGIGLQLTRDSDATFDELYKDDFVGFETIKLGYTRRLNLRWQWGMELNLNVIRYLNVSKSLADYHQTSTSFEYIEKEYGHTFTGYLDVPMYIKYQPINQKYGILAGVEVGYAFNKSASNTYRTAGENEVIDPLKEWTNIDQHIKNFDFGLFAGATYRIWRGLELEVRYSLGLNDISHNNFWGESRHTTTNLSCSLNYRWKF